MSSPSLGLGQATRGLAPLNAEGLGPTLRWPQHNMALSRARYRAPDSIHVTKGPDEYETNKGGQYEYKISDAPVKAYMVTYKWSHVTRNYMEVGSCPGPGPPHTLSSGWREPHASMVLPRPEPSIG